MKCQLKKIYHDTTEQVNLLNYFLAIRVPLGYLSTFAMLFQLHGEGSKLNHP